MNIFKKIVLFFILRGKYNKYLNNLNTSKFEIINSIDSNICDIYNLIKNNPTKYSRFIKIYEDKEKEIEEHNKVINILSDFVQKIDIDEILENPTIIDFSLYDEQVSLLKKHHFDHTNINEFLKIYDNRDLVIEQYNLLNEFNEKINPKNKYIDRNIKQDIIDFIQKIEAKIKEYKFLFYQFDRLDSIEEIITQNNETFVYQNINNSLFNNIDGKSLDIDQRKAILCDDVANLVVAGAGSGKTLTICGKVKYLIEEKKIDPSDILLISYSKKSADDLERKVQLIHPFVHAYTFHKLGLDILKKATHLKYDIEEQYSAIIEKYFREKLFEDPIMMRKVFTYYALFLDYETNDKVYNSKSELYEDLKKQDYHTIKDTLSSLGNEHKNNVTLKKEKVKSIEELIIANYYFINGIDYTYESPYEYDVSSTEFRQYKPDFFINNYHIYHEHYGIDKNGNALQFGKEESEKYKATMEWKRETHRHYGTICIESYSYEFKDNTIFDNLERKLKGLGVEYKPLSNEQIYDALNSIYCGHNFKSFIKVLSTFISLYKARYIDDSNFELLLLKSKNVGAYSHIRSKMFLEIAKTIYNYYIDTIRLNNRIDFDDMILKSREVLDKLDDYKYKYIIVDEFQDISYSRMEFLKALIKHGNSRLFAVGDDYQAIYRFSGCDLDIFINFKKYFGDCSFNMIHATHRNSQELQNIVTPFIQRNPDQLKKNIVSNKYLENPIQINYYHINKHLAFMMILKKIFLESDKTNILVLGRNNFDIDSILGDNLKYIKSKQLIVCDYYPELTIHYSTVHASKGLEEDNVILINCDEAITGFPNKVEDDPILSLVLSNDSNFIFAEERRLFYVALTRTRERCYLLVNAEKPSIFIEELKDKCYIVNPQKGEDPKDIRYCPICGGKLVLKESKNGIKFYSCCYYPYCDYLNRDLKSVYYNRRCPRCGDYLTVRRNRYGHPFLGCHNYPNCDFSCEFDDFN